MPVVHVAPVTAAAILIGSAAALSSAAGEASRSPDEGESRPAAQMGVVWVDTYADRKSRSDLGRTPEEQIEWLLQFDLREHCDIPDEMDEAKWLRETFKFYENIEWVTFLTVGVAVQHQERVLEPSAKTSILLTLRSYRRRLELQRVTEAGVEELPFAPSVNALTWQIAGIRSLQVSGDRIALGEGEWITFVTRTINVAEHLPAGLYRMRWRNPGGAGVADSIELNTDWHYFVINARDMPEGDPADRVPWRGVVQEGDAGGH